MRLIAIDAGRTTWLFPFEEIAPLEPMVGGQLTAALVARYSFKGFPAENTPREELSKNGAKFENGQFLYLDRLVPIGELAVFSDGVVVNSSSTEAASAFIEDLLDYVRSQFRFREFTSRPRKIVASQLIVEFDTPLATLMPTFSKIQGLIAKETGEVYGASNPMDFFRLDFQLDKEKSHLEYALPRFTIERRAGVSFSQERYYCSALLDTQRHLFILEEMEKMISS